MIGIPGLTASLGTGPAVSGATSGPNVSGNVTFGGGFLTQLSRTNPTGLMLMIGAIGIAALVLLIGGAKPRRKRKRR